MTHEPTAGPGPAFTPTVCWLCGRRAEGLGVGKFPSDRHPHDDPHFLCSNCLPLAAQLRATTKFDHYEEKAIDMTIEEAGKLVEQNGVQLDEWSEDQVREFVVSIILGFGSAIREQVREGEVPF